MDATYLTPHDRHELLATLTGTGGRLLDQVIERRLGELEVLAGRAALDCSGSPDRLLGELEAFIREAEHLRYLRDRLGVLATQCAGTAAGGPG